jgi:iron(III) transport system substrate-binding protein
MVRRSATGMERVRLLVRSGAWLGATALLCTALSACGSSGQPSGQPSGQTLTLYNGQHLQTTNALVVAFEKESGIHIAVHSDDEDVLANQIIEEGSRSPADLFFTENSPALMSLEEHGLLAVVSSSTRSHVPSRYNSPDGDWVGVTARVNVLVYNTNLLRAGQVPTSMLDLGRPQWKNKIAIAPGETDFQPIVTSMLRTYGHAAALNWLEGLKQNAGALDYPDNETLVDMVSRRSNSIDLCSLNQYYWYREREMVGAADMHSAIAFLAPRDPGYVLDVSGMGILASSRHKSAAQRFLAFVVSHRGQEIIAHSDSFEYPLGSGVLTAQPLRPWSQLQPAPLTVAELGDGSAAVALEQEAGLI